MMTGAVGVASRPEPARNRRGDSADAGRAGAEPGSARAAGQR